MEMGNFVDFVERYNLEGDCAKGIKLSPKFDGDGMNIKVQNRHNHTHLFCLPYEDITLNTDDYVHTSFHLSTRFPLILYTPIISSL